MGGGGDLVESSALAAPGESEIETGPPFQIDVIGGGNVVVLLVVAVGLSRGYDTARPLPPLYLALFGVLAVLFLVSRPDRINSILEFVAWRFQALGGGGTGKPWRRGPRLLRIEEIADERGGSMVYLMASVTFAAVSVLIVDTGLGIESPFVPLATAPAVFAPFVAKDVGRVLIVLVVAGVAMAGLTAAAPRSPCGSGGCPAPLQSDIRECELPGSGAPASEPERTCAKERVESRFEPASWLYFLVSFLMLIVAGVIGAFRLRTEGNLRGEIADLEAKLGIRGVNGEQPGIDPPHPSPDGAGGASRQQET